MRWIPQHMPPMRTLAVGVTAVVLICAAPVVKAAYGSVPITLVYGTSENSGETTTAITITQDQIDPTHGFSGTSLEDVRSQAELVAYASTLMKNNAHIQSISISEHSISMTYQSTIYIQNFGVRSIARTVTVTDSGAVSVEKPWYTSLSDDTTKNNPEVGFRDIELTKDSSGLQPQTQARILMRMQGRFEIGVL